MTRSETVDALGAWTYGIARSEIEKFVTRVTRSGSPDFVPAEDRIAVFDNDGTLWCEKPMPIELGFILQRLAAMADTNADLLKRQPWKAAHDKDQDWLAGSITKHYRGDDSDAKQLMAGILEAFRGWSVEDYETAAGAFLHNTHPLLRRPFTSCGYLPMVQLVRYLEMNGFTNYIASGGDRDFMRAFASRIYGIPPERVIGSTNGLKYQEDAKGGKVVYQATMDVFDDGPAKPVRIWSRVGRRPIIAVGNSNGDIPMLQYAGGSSSALRLLVFHDDKEREFDYVSGAEDALEQATKQGWTVISVRNDWNTVFKDEAFGPRRVA